MKYQNSEYLHIKENDLYLKPKILRGRIMYWMIFKLKIQIRSPLEWASQSFDVFSDRYKTSNILKSLRILLKRARNVTHRQILTVHKKSNSNMMLKIKRNGKWYDGNIVRELNLRFHSSFCASRSTSKSLSCSISWSITICTIYIFNFWTWK